MRPIRIILLFIVTFQLGFLAAGQSLPVWGNTEPKAAGSDWLVTPVKIKAQVYRNSNGNELVLYNGLVKRTFRIAPNVACIDYQNLTTGRQLLRAVKAEARLTINAAGITMWAACTGKKKMLTCYRTKQ